MKAIQIQAFGGPEQLSLQELPVPDLKPGEVLVKTTACGVNPIDWKTCSGGGAAPFIGDLPFVPGWEMSGIVSAVADDVSEFSAGDSVFGLLRFPTPASCFAEQVAAPADQIAKCPAAVDLIAAGGLPIAGLTAWQALFDKADLKAGKRVLVLAAAGGVGHLAVQIAKSQEAEVIVTASASNHDYLSSIGADQCIDYRSEDVTALIKDVDIVIDGVGGDTGIAALACLKQDGVLVTLPSVTKDAVIAAGEQAGKRVESIRVEANAEQLDQLAKLISQGALKLNVQGTYPLADAATAFDQIATGHTRGKLILTV